jgi:hypothetical protein
MHGSSNNNSNSGGGGVLPSVVVLRLGLGVYKGDNADLSLLMALSVIL